MSIQEQCEKLSATLRGATSRATELAGGGCALLFCAMPGDKAHDARAQLRASAGFDDNQAIESACRALFPATRQVLEGAKTARFVAQPDLGPKAAGGITIHPLAIDGGVNGALVVGYPEEPGQAVFQQIAQLAASASLHLDHALISAELVELKKKSVESEASNDDDRGDELLKLSEALFAQDIELRRNNEKLGKIEKLKNDFIEKMSCELRTPLNSIIEAIISVLAGENEAISDAAKASMRSALDEGNAFQRTLENILDLWRVKQGELPIQIQEVSMAELIEEAIFSVQDTLSDKPVMITKEVEVPLPVFKTDLAKLNQILFLLLDNAAKFSEAGEIKICARLDGVTLDCEVSDQGIGICADDQAFIFDEFYQVDEGQTSKYRGAGLGLTLVRDLIVLLDGEIDLESEAGQGTRVRFRIPVQAAR